VRNNYFIYKEFQSPFHRVNEWSNALHCRYFTVKLGFNPLFIGSMNEACSSPEFYCCRRSSFNPLFIGSMNEAR
jgi:hypothetical protein